MQLSRLPRGNTTEIMEIRNISALIYLNNRVGIDDRSEVFMIIKTGLVDAIFMRLYSAYIQI